MHSIPTERQPKQAVLHKWAKPPDDHVKINFDGAFNEGSNSGG